MPIDRTKSQPNLPAYNTSREMKFNAIFTPICEPPGLEKMVAKVACQSKPCFITTACFTVFSLTQYIGNILSPIRYQEFRLLE